MGIYIRADSIFRLSHHKNILINRFLWKLEASFRKLKLEHCCTVFSKHDLQLILGVLYSGAQHVHGRKYVWRLTNQGGWMGDNI